MKINLSLILIFLICVFNLNIYCAQEKKTSKDLTCRQVIKKLGQQEFNWHILSLPYDLNKLIISYVGYEFFKTINCCCDPSNKTRIQSVALFDKYIAVSEVSESSSSIDLPEPSKINLFDLKTGNLLSSISTPGYVVNLYAINQNLLALSIFNYLDPNDDPIKDQNRFNNVGACYIDNNGQILDPRILNNENGSQKLFNNPKLPELASICKALKGDNIRVFNLKSYQNNDNIFSMPAIKFGGISAMSYSPNGQYLAVVIAYTGIFILTRDRQKKKVRDRFIDEVNHIFWSEDTSYLIVLVNFVVEEKKGCYLVKYNVENFDKIKASAPLKISNTKCEKAFLVGKLIFFVDAKNLIHIINSDTGAFIQKLESYENRSHYQPSVSVCKDGKYLASCYGGQLVNIWQNQAAILLELLNRNKDKYKLAQC